MGSPENAYDNGDNIVQGESLSPERVTDNNAETIALSPDPDLYSEVGELAQYLNEIVGKIRSAGSMMESVSNQIPFGRDELSEVSRKTEEATQKILDDADKVIDNDDLMFERIASLKATLLDESLKSEIKVQEELKTLSSLLDDNKATMFNLVGTLSFQDPAGQQLRKVSTSLEQLRARILKMVVTFGRGAKRVKIAEAREEELLSGLEYSSEGDTLDQDLVDSVLKEYGF